MSGETFAGSRVLWTALQWGVRDNTGTLFLRFADKQEKESASWTVASSSFRPPQAWSVSFRRAARLQRRPAATAGCRLERLMTQLHDQQLFTGELLVAEKGRVIYEGAFGAADRRTGRPYTTATRSCLASLSKPITAVAIMMLGEQRRLTYDDPLSKFLTGFANPVGAVTIRQLLTHTSGIPDYPELNVDRPGVTNAEILTALQKIQKPDVPPRTK